ncbi:hypothetical protein DTO027I6_9876 [Penicillium roqueforti]|nr:hypothetical protein DTO027I6_9876 [Penicillium roqueforti]
MLRSLRSRLALPSQFTFLVLNSLGLLFGHLHNSQIPDPDAYKSNLHRTLGWLAMCVIIVHFCLTSIFAYAGRGESSPRPYEGAASLKCSTNEHESCWFLASIQGTVGGNSSITHSAVSPSYKPPAGYSRCEKLKELPAKVTGTRESPQSTRNGFIQSDRVRVIISSWALRILSVTYNVANHTILPFGFIVLATGAMAHDDIIGSHEFFRWLAHLIKGSIFLCYGLFTLGRFIGCWANLGWAWNKKPSAHVCVNMKSQFPSVEAVESFVIFGYSVIDTFLGSLAKRHDEWSATHLRHAPITMLLFSGGLAGMLLESTHMLQWVNNSILQTPAHYSSDEAWQPPKSQCVPLNPIPALIILLFGLIMGWQYKDCTDPTRILTYLLLFIKPPTSNLPARPPTEIIAAFCLISGGVNFMLS